MPPSSLGETLTKKEGKMDTTTPDGGAEQAQPTTTEAVTTGQNADQVITTDSNGTPELQPVTSQSESVEAAPEPEAEQPTEPVAQAPADDVEEWAKKKGISLEDPKKIAQMYRDAEKKMHEASAKARELEQATIAAQTLDYTGDDDRDNLAQTVNQLLIQNNVRDFFGNNPEAREYESKMAEIVTQRPHLKNDLDALYALAKTDPSRETELKQAGGREALTNLAQKQQQVPPGANATNSGVYESQTITPRNVYDLIDKNDQAWFEKNHDAINKAISG